MRPGLTRGCVYGLFFSSPLLVLIAIVIWRLL